MARWGRTLAQCLHHDVVRVYAVLTGLLTLEFLLRWMGGVLVVPILWGWSIADLVEGVGAAVLIGWLLWRYWRFVPNLYRFAVAYPGLLLVLVVVYVLVYALLGTDYGVQYQFWHDDAFTRLGAAFAATLLLAVVGVLAFYLDPRPYWSAALIDDYFGGGDARLAPTVQGGKIEPQRFYWLRSPNVIRLSRFLELARWAFLTLLMAPALLPAIFTSVPRTPPWALFGWDLIANEANSGSYRWAHSYYSDVLTHPLARLANALAWGLGIALGVLAVKVLYWVGERTRPHLTHIGGWSVVHLLWQLPGKLEAKILETFDRRPETFAPRKNARCTFAAAPGTSGTTPAPDHPQINQGTCPIPVCPGATPPERDEALDECLEFQESRASVVNFYFVFLFFYLVVLNLPGIYDWLVSAAFSICALLSLLAMTYTWFAGFYAHWRVPTLGLLVAWLLFWNHDPFKLRFENMDGYYASGGPVVLRPVVHALRDEENASAPRSAEDRAAALIDDETARRNWLAQFRDHPGQPIAAVTKAAKPKLVVVAVSGGATRAGYWAAVVLDRLEKEVGQGDGSDFGRHVRIITGSSGGMLGTAFYVLHRTERVPPDAAALTPRLVRADGAPAEPLGEKWVDRIPRDSLQSVAKFLALRETWRAFLPRLWWDDDRGIRLERTWEALRFPLSKLKPLEGRGLIPSLILSPMMIEDGRQLLISNLDLRAASQGPDETHRRWVGMSCGSAITAQGPGTKQIDYSISGLEFFRLFPEAKGLFLSTAVRMSASFPYVSPAVNLPSDPAHRVVDAGYYDNYGIQTATSWIYDNREWLAANTSGVLLVQIRDSTSIVDRIGINDTPESPWDTVARGFQFFTSPIEGFSKARVSSGTFRNDQAIQELGDLFTGTMRAKMTESRSFFTTVVLENAAEVTPMPHTESWPGTEFVRAERATEDAADQVARHADQDTHATGVSMTWYLTRAEREALDLAIPDPRMDRRALDRQWRTKHIDLLWNAIVELPADDPRRAHAMSDFQRVSNYEKIVQLKDWWKKGLTEAIPPAPAASSPQ